MYQLFIVPYVFIGASCMGIFSWMPTVETCSYWINPEIWTTSVPFLSPHPCALISHPSMVLDRASSTKASICAVTAILWIGWNKFMSDTARNCGWSQYPLTLPVTGFPAGCCDLTGSFKAWHWDLGSCLWWHVSAVIAFKQEIYQDHSISPNLNIFTSLWCRLTQWQATIAPWTATSIAPGCNEVNEPHNPTTWEILTIISNLLEYFNAYAIVHLHKETWCHWPGLTLSICIVSSQESHATLELLYLLLASAWTCWHACHVKELGSQIDRSLDEILGKH